jgi:parallel beta-helix repeat protein
MQKRIVLAALAAALGVAALGYSAAPTSATVICDRYAATTGSDSAAGTSTAPYRTAQKLVNSLTAGQTGCLLGGTYNEHVRFNHGGTVGSPIRLTSARGTRATVVGRMYVPDESNDVVVSNLTLDGINSSVMPSPTISGDRVTFSDNDVSNENTAICFAIGSTPAEGYGISYDVTIERNRIHNCGTMPPINHLHGIYVNSARNTVIRDNYIYDNADRGVQLFPDSQGTIIEYNVIDGNGEGVIFSGADGYASSNNTVRFNIIANSRDRYNVESWWAAGNPVGTGNLATQNCLFNGALGNVDPYDPGFTATSNTIANPLFVDRGSKNFNLQSGSPCAGYGPRTGISSETPPPPPPPPPPPNNLVAPVSTQVPVITGQARANQKLTASTGKWTGTPSFTFGYAWGRCDSAGTACSSTRKAGSTYALTSTDIGYRMVVTVTATNSAGKSAATSAPTATIGAKNGKTARPTAAFSRSFLKRWLAR